MSLAPPPPPPPSAPIPSFPSNKSNPKDGRGLLLESIRQGKSLKKTTTIDKSAPLISGTVAGKSPQSNNTNNATRIPSNNKQNDAPSPPSGLGGLFANGIPKLKATGLPIGQAYQQYRNENDGVKSNSFSLSNSNNNNSNKVNHLNRTNVTKTRGPPPQPPGLPPKNSSPDAETNDGLPVHNRSGSVVSLNDSYQNRASDAGQHIINHGKPTLAPKPNRAANKSVGNRNIQNDGRSNVGRTQSMRVPKCPSNVADSSNGSQYPEYNQSELYRTNIRNKLPSFHQSQESLGRRNNRSSSPPKTPSNATSWGSSLNSPNATLRRPHVSPLRPPLSKPPPPPRVLPGPPSCPPPPPPSHAPPLPPHREHPAPPPPRQTNNLMNSGATPVFNFTNSLAPPKPPTRGSSMRNANSVSTMSSFETKFIFHSLNEFPPPQPYQNVIKIYNSRIQAKQQAPQPPLQLQQSVNRPWQCENASNC